MNRAQRLLDEVRAEPPGAIDLDQAWGRIARSIEARRARRWFALTSVVVFGAGAAFAASLGAREPLVELAPAPIPAASRPARSVQLVRPAPPPSAAPMRGRIVVHGPADTATVAAPVEIVTPVERVVPSARSAPLPERSRAPAPVVQPRGVRELGEHDVP